MFTSYILSILVLLFNFLHLFLSMVHCGPTIFGTHMSYTPPHIHHITLFHPLHSPPPFSLFHRQIHHHITFLVLTHEARGGGKIFSQEGAGSGVAAPTTWAHAQPPSPL
jgi:hypothetical protein